MAGATQTGPTLERNLDCLGTRNARLVRMIRQVALPAAVQFRDTRQGVLAVTVAGRPLCSLHRPLDEAERLATTVDVAEHAVVAVTGFGAGYHVQALARRLDGTGLIVVFEPDLGLLRAVLETIDHTAWLARASVAWVSDPDDHGELGRLLAGTEPLIAHGVGTLVHPASAARLAGQADRFARTFRSFLQTARTSITAALTESANMVGTLSRNLDHYAAGGGVAELAGAAAGHPAVVVAAGPSLRRNLGRLAEPAVRERCVIIAVQTALRPMLARGIRPHFVCALDDHEICRRFYAGLRAADVEGITLVADPKTHPGVIDLFPGPVRCCASAFLDEVLGDLKRDMGTLPAGGTVAQLALYLARFLGCNPIALMGQDLAFTDGLYYTQGTAIAEVWAPELNAFNTIEMMEWQRIARHQPHLHEMRDAHGRRILTDAQMVYYLRQLERDFARLEQEGVTVIDATEGGLPKQHTVPMTLADVLASHATRPLPPLPAAPTRLDERRRHAAASRVEVLCVQIASVQQILDRKAAALREGDGRIVERCDGELGGHRDALALLRYVNQVGTLKRRKADRRLQVLRDTLGEHERAQVRRERDLDEVAWLSAAAAETLASLQEACVLLRGRPREHAAVEVGRSQGGRVAAVVPVDPERNGAGVRRSLAEPFAGRTVLQATLERLGRSRALAEIVLLVPAGVAVEPLIDRRAVDVPVEIERTEGSPFGPEQEAVIAARRWSPAGWRGGIAGMSVYDEVLCPRASLRVMRRRRLAAAVLVGADWPLVDPSAAGGLDALVRRSRERPDGHELVFTQTPPGLGGCLVSASLMERLCERSRASTIGALLAYQPRTPQHDPIARSVNVQIEERVAWARLRGTFDAPRHRARLRSALERDWSASGLPATECVARLADRWRHENDALPAHLVLELVSGGGAVLDVALAGRLLGELAEAGDGAVTLGGRGDPLLHPRFDEIVRMARRSGMCVHVRTELAVDPATVERLLEAGPEVVSVDLHAHRAETYRRIRGADRLERVTANLERLIEGRRRLVDFGPTGSLALPWVVPRIRRGRAVLEEIPPFFDRWTAALGTAVIDPAPAGDDLVPTCPPDRIFDDEARQRMTVLADGTVPVSEREPTGHRLEVAWSETPLGESWSALLAARARHAARCGPRTLVDLP